MTAAARRRLRVAGGVLILGLLLWRVGTAPVLDGLRTVDVRALLLATGIAFPTTVCCAWRWRLVSRGLGAELGLAPAVSRYYRSQFLNTVLPGGVLGDVHRGLRQGHDVGDPGRGLRAVLWERTAGQVVQLAVAVLVLTVLPSPFRATWVALAVLAVPVAVALRSGTTVLVRAAPSSRTGWSRLLSTARTDLRRAVLAADVWPGVLLASTLAVAGHLAMFVLAARTAGVAAPVPVLLPLALLALLAMGVPANVAGWGPREGVAAWAFAAAGLGAGAGLSTAVVYGVLTFAAGLPGAVVLGWLWWRPDGPRRRPAASRGPEREPAPVGGGSS